MEQSLTMDEENQLLLWKITTEQLDKDRVSWQMLEHNQVPGILAFDHYYIDDVVCFRYDYTNLCCIEKYFQKAQADYDTVHFLCTEILKIMLDGEDYLLKMEGYLLCAEWVFWNRFEKKVWVCYLPGRKKEQKSDFKKLVEYFMEHVDHKDKKAVTFIYKLYDGLASDGYNVQELWKLVQKIDEEMADKKQEEFYCQGKKETQEVCEEALGLQKEEKRIEGTKEEAEYVRVRLCPVISRSEKHSIQSQLLKVMTEYAFPIKKDGFVVGSGEKCDLQLPMERIEKEHAELSYEEHTLYLTNRASACGTQLNAKRISAYEKAACCDNDTISFADISFRIRISPM